MRVNEMEELDLAFFVCVYGAHLISLRFFQHMIEENEKRDKKK